MEALTSVAGSSRSSEFLSRRSQIGITVLSGLCSSRSVDGSILRDTRAAASANPCHAMGRAAESCENETNLWGY
jgi:hypothetical protein